MSALLRSLLPAVPRSARPYSTQPALAARAPYHVPRNTRGSIPVYTDIRNGGTRHLTLIRNIQGNVDALANDLAASLHPLGSPEAQRMRVHTIRSKHIVLSGGRWKHDVIRWLVAKGF